MFVYSRGVRAATQPATCLFHTVLSSVLTILSASRTEIISTDLIHHITLLDNVIPSYLGLTGVSDSYYLYAVMSSVIKADAVEHNISIYGGFPFIFLTVFITE